MKSELTQDRWRIYSDNIAMTRWLQSTIQGMLNTELADTSLPVTDAEFSRSGDPRYFWTEHVYAHEEDIALTWYDIGEPLLIHTTPQTDPARPYGVCTVLIPALGARLTRNGRRPSASPGRVSAKAARSAPAPWRSRKAGRPTNNPIIRPRRLTRPAIGVITPPTEIGGRQYAQYHSSGIRRGHWLVRDMVGARQLACRLHRGEPRLPQRRS